MGDGEQSDGGGGWQESELSVTPLPGLGACLDTQLGGLGLGYGPTAHRVPGHTAGRTLQ